MIRRLNDAETKQLDQSENKISSIELQSCTGHKPTTNEKSLIDSYGKFCNDKFTSDNILSTRKRNMYI